MSLEDIMGTYKMNADAYKLARETEEHAVMQGRPKHNPRINEQIAAHLGHMAQSMTSIALELATDIERTRRDAEDVIVFRQNRLLIEGREKLVADLYTVQQKLANAESATKAAQQRNVAINSYLGQISDRCAAMVVGSERQDESEAHNILADFSSEYISLTVLLALHAAGIRIRVAKKVAELMEDELVVEVVLPEPAKSDAPA